MLAVRKGVSVLHVPGNRFKEDLLHFLPWIWNKAGWPVVPWTFLLAFSLASQGPPLVTTACQRWSREALQWHQPNPSASSEAAYLVPWICERPFCLSALFLAWSSFTWHLSPASCPLSPSSCSPLALLPWDVGHRQRLLGTLALQGTRLPCGILRIRSLNKLSLCPWRLGSSLFAFLSSFRILSSPV